MKWNTAVDIHWTVNIVQNILRGPILGCDTYDGL